MQKITKALIGIVLILCLNLNAQADTFEADSFLFEVLSYENPECRLLGSIVPIEGELIIPNSVVNNHHTEENQNLETTFKVTEIGDGAFYMNATITSVVFGSNIVSVGYQAFCECENLTQVVFNNTL